MPDHEDSLGGETLDGGEADLSERSLSDGHTLGDTAANSLGDQHTLGDAKVADELFDDGMKLEDLSERYTEERVLGKGGFGEVILATDTRLGRKVAIKRIQGKAARSKTAVQRFLTEAQSIAGLNHNNIVQIYDYGRAVDGPFLIMECVAGGSLLDQCRKGAIEPDEAVKIFSQLCDGLAKAHSAGIIHRDIKPANVLMTEDGVPKLTDFGLAKDDTADTGMTMEGAVIGTLDFMPPEQRQGAELTDHRSDLWSLAATFYQMLNGKSPKVINISSLPPKLQAVVAKALEESKEDRFQSAHEMREEMLQAYSGKMDTSRALGEGECPQCATPNPPLGKFCVECSAILQVQCMKCEVEIQIWNKACGACGAQQQPLVEDQLKQLQKHHDEAEQFLQELKFGEADTAANVIAAVKDSRLQKFQVWHEEFSQRLVDTQKTEYEHLEGLLEEAKTHEEKYDYEAARRSLNKVDKRLREHELENLGSAKSIGKRITGVLRRIKKISTANETVKLTAVSLLEGFEFDNAIAASNGIETDDHHHHLKEYDDWFNEFREEVRDKSNAAYKQLEEQLSQALEHEEDFDYEAARGALNEVDKRLKDHELENLGSAKTIGKRITGVLRRVKKLSTANETVRQQAVSFFEELEFDKALEASNGIETDDHPHLEEYTAWFNEFRDEVRDKHSVAYKQLEDQLTQALEHEENFDYEAGLESLTHVDSRLFETRMEFFADAASDISSRLTEKKMRVEELEEIIRARFSAQQLIGLLPLVCELDGLNPASPRIEKLKLQMEKREAELIKVRDNACEKASLLIGEQKYSEALNILNKVSEEVRNKKFEEVKKKSNDLFTELIALRDKIAVAVDGNQLNPALLSNLERCLGLKADQDDLVKLKQDLVFRDIKINERNQQIIKKIEHLIQHAQFAEAIQLITKIAPGAQSVTIMELGHKASSFSIKRQKAVLSGTNALDDENFELAVAVFNSYIIEIECAGIQDQEIRQMIREAKSEKTAADTLAMLKHVGKFFAICGGLVFLAVLLYGIWNAGFSFWTSAIWITVCWTGGAIVAHTYTPTRFLILLRLLGVAASFFIICQTLEAGDDFGGRLFLIVVFFISWIMFIIPEVERQARVSEKWLGIVSTLLFVWLCYLTWAAGTNPLWGEMVSTLLFLFGGVVCLGLASGQET